MSPMTSETQCMVRHSVGDVFTWVIIIAIVMSLIATYLYFSLSEYRRGLA